MNECIKREIGGYMELEHFRGREYHSGALRFHSARGAIRFAVTSRKKELVYLPLFLCGSVAQELAGAGIQVQTYAIGDDLLPEAAFAPKKDGAVLVVNYFGQLGNETISRLRQRFPDLIVDNVQAFFQPPAPGVDTVYSCRKYFGVPDGAYLYTDLPRGDYDRLPMAASAGWMAHLTGRYEQGAEKNYRHFQENEERLSTMPLCRMSALSMDLLRAVDHEDCIRRRERNFHALERELGRWNGLTVKNCAGAFMYPFLVDQAPKLRELLIAKKIYVPRLWPRLSGRAEEGSLEARLADKILWLPIDQRYGEAEMGYIADQIKNTGIVKG